MSLCLTLDRPRYYKKKYHFDDDLKTLKKCRDDINKVIKWGTKNKSHTIYLTKNSMRKLDKLSDEIEDASGFAESAHTDWELDGQDDVDTNDIGYGHLKSCREWLLKHFGGSIINPDSMFHEMYHFPDGFDSTLYHFIMQPDSDGHLTWQQCQHLYSMFKACKPKRNDIKHTLSQLLEGFKESAESKRNLFWC